ncbi:NAD-dependent epimerase/dehydratase family protein [Flavobacterium branchiicola]|uniref:NAD-dependent epimerase/dehydratase family protein n=1 Tax=Flavobacterium branchiicola TaxID=1114875 RepID=A0ABV9PFF9_9FLAO|nr:NAD-dependent epimerase/dehydratase family protein [Flavobacterium branchiicola]MBS7255481.1 NAD-dependent epimerase/dehydratase family protein [Flavobacterium branchiicola]
MRSILITGGAGNVGSAIASKLAEDTSNFIVIVDNLSTGNLSKIPKCDNIVFIKADANNYNDIVPIFGRYNFDFVFHYAAVVGVKRTLANPILVLNDIEGIKNILSLSKNSGVKRVFYSSSSEVYGEPFEIPQNEKTTPLNSRLPYAIVKNIGEAFFKSYFQEYGLEYTIFRFFNTYGPNQSEDFVVPRFIKAAIKNEPIYLYGDGLQTRSFCYVQDNIDTCIKALYEDKCVNDVLNVGSDTEMTILDLAKQIILIANSQSEIIHLPALEEGDMLRRCPDTTKMKKLLGRDLVTLENGIKKLIQHYENRN